MATTKSTTDRTKKATTASKQDQQQPAADAVNETAGKSKEELEEKAFWDEWQTVEGKQESLDRDYQTIRMVREKAEVYKNFGCFSVSTNIPVPNSIGFEVSIRTDNESTNTRQRTGFGVYAFSDHLADKRVII